MLCGCFGPVEDSSSISSTALVGANRVAFVYHGLRTRPPLITYPDGGIPTYVKDDFIVAVVGADGPVRKLAYFRNEALHGTGSVSLRWYPENPGYLYAFRAGQRDYDSHYLSDEVRIRIADGAVQHLKLGDQLAANGRELGADGFGTIMPLDDSGSLLLGATMGERRELWLRPVSGSIRKLADFDGFDVVAGPDIVFSVNGPPLTTYALNWHTGKVRTIMRSKLRTTGLNWHDFDAKDDPAYKAMNRPQLQSSNPAHVEVDGITLTYFNGDKSLWSRQVRF